MLDQELPPHLDVPVLDVGQLPVESGAPRIALDARDLAVEKGRVGLVVEVVEPRRRGRGGGGGGGRSRWHVGS
jgi:hypothetical protein